ncbi:hypothetical protein BJY59DRAFT_675328, partial [Rhodotorula toruloides]
TETDNVAAAGALVEGLGDDDVDGEGVKAERLEEVLGVGVDLEGLALRVESRDLGDVVVLALALLLLELERDAADGTLLDALHEVRREAGNLVAQALRRDDGNLVADLLVRVEVKGQARVVLLDDDARGALDSLGANTAPVHASTSGQFSSSRWVEVRVLVVGAREVESSRTGLPGPASAPFLHRTGLLALSLP